MTAAELEGGYLEVVLLGPVEVRRGEGALHLGGSRQRALLALLALNANELMPSERLVSSLFGVDAPESSVNSLQVAVSRLRRVLGDGLIETRNGGYLLHLSPDQLDSARFERQAAEGRARLANGDSPEAAALLRQALGLFNGSPLADIASFDFAQAEIRRLDELRLAALMDRIEADLDVGRGAELVPELEAFVREYPLQERLRAQLMLALYGSGRQSDALEAYRDIRELLSEELGLEPSRALQDLERAILRHDPKLEHRGQANADAPASDSRIVVCPFKGLAAFGAEDAPYFFGRERAVDELLTHLAGVPFVGLVGPSGSGKSSLLQAGLLSALAEGALPGSEAWHQCLVRPGDTSRLDLPDPSSTGRLVVAVDQLEEVFTSPLDESQRASFVAAVASAALDPGRRYVVVVSLRADFYGQCAAYGEFASLLSSNHVLLGAMERDELARAIERPAARAGLEVERELVDALVADIDGEPGALPLLATSLLELWRERQGRVLTLASYRLSGGLRGAVARLAERAYAGLGAGEQSIARAIFLRLATEEDGRVSRRRVSVDELEFAPGSHVGHVVSALTAARLLTASTGMLEVSHEALLSEWPRLRGWIDEDRDGRRLHGHLGAAAREWNARGRDTADLYRGPRLAAALEWTDLHDPELNRLEHEFVEQSRIADEREAARERRQNRRLKSLLAGAGMLLVLALAAGVIAFVAQSRKQHEATVALARELGAEAVTAPRIDQAMLLAGEAVHLNRSAQTGGTLLATLLRSPNVLGTISSPILSRPQKIALSPDGQTLAVSDNLNTVRFYDASTLRLRRVVQKLGYTSPVAYLPGRTRLAAFGGSGSRIDIRDARTLRLLRTLRLDRRWLSGPIDGDAPLLVTPDGRTLLYVYDLLRPDGSDGRDYVDRWSLRTGRLLGTVGLPLRGVVSATLLDRGRRLAVGGGHALAIFDLGSLRTLRTVPLPSKSLFATIAPKGGTVVVGTADGSVSFIQPTGRTTTASGGTSGIEAVRFSPDGQQVATTSDDGSVIVWDPRTARPMLRLVGHEGLVHAATFSPDSRTLFTSSLDGAIFKWAVGTSRRFGVPFSVPSRPTPNSDDIYVAPPLAVSATGSDFAVVAGSATVDVLGTRSGKRSETFRVHAPLVTSLAFSPHAPLLAAAGADGLVQLWGVAEAPRLLRTLGGLRSLNGSPEEVATVAFSPDGRLVAAGDVNHTPGRTPYRFGTVAVWDAASGRLLWHVRNRLGWVHTVAFSPSGDVLAAAQEAGGARIYDAKTGRLERALHLYGGAEANWVYDTLAFAPNGELATGTYQGILQFWNPRTGTVIGRPRLVASAPVSSIAFAPSGDVIATTGGSDGLAKLWTKHGVQQFGADLPGSRGSWGNAAYAPNGARLVVVDADGRGVIWPTSVEAWLQHACAVAGRNFTREEWTRFVGNRPYARTCPE